jgi:hypothetical protein
MRISDSDMAVPGAVAHSAPPPPPRPNAPHQGHQAATIQRRDESRRQSKETNHEYPQPRGHMQMIQKGRLTNRTQKKRSRGVFLAKHAPLAMPLYLDWSE